MNPGQDLAAWLHERLRAKWAYYALRKWWGTSGSERPGWQGRLYWFELSTDYNDWFAVPAWGSTPEEAELQLEATLRCLGVVRLMRRGALEDALALGFPRCPRCARLMSAGVQFAWRRVQQWRCDHRGCLYRIWTLDAFGHRPTPRPSALGAGSPYDVTTPDYREG